MRKKRNLVSLIIILCYFITLVLPNTIKAEQVVSKPNKDSIVNAESLNNLVELEKTDRLNPSR